MPLCFVYKIPDDGNLKFNFTNALTLQHPPQSTIVNVDGPWRLETRPDIRKLGRLVISFSVSFVISIAAVYGLTGFFLTRMCGKL